MENTNKNIPTNEATEDVAANERPCTKSVPDHVITHVSSPETLFKCLEKLAELEGSHSAVTIEIPLSYFEELIKARTERDVAKSIVLNLETYRSGETLKRMFETLDGKGFVDKE